MIYIFASGDRYGGTVYHDTSIDIFFMFNEDGEEVEVIVWNVKFVMGHLKSFTEGMKKILKKGSYELLNTANALFVYREWLFITPLVQSEP